MSSEGGREIEAARKHLAAAKAQVLEASEMTEKANAMIEAAKSMKQSADAMTQRATKEVKDAQQMLADAERRWGNSNNKNISDGAPGPSITIGSTFPSYHDLSRAVHIYWTSIGQTKLQLFRSTSVSFSEVEGKELFGTPLYNPDDGHTKPHKFLGGVRSSAIIKMNMASVPSKLTFHGLVKTNITKLCRQPI